MTASAAETGPRTATPSPDPRSTSTALTTAEPTSGMATAGTATASAATVVGGDSTDPLTLDLARADLLARQQGPTVRAATGQLAQAAAEADQAWAPWRPRLDLRAQTQRARSATLVTRDERDLGASDHQLRNQLAAGAEASQLIWQYARFDAARLGAAGARAAAAADQAIARRDAARSARLAVIGLHRAWSLVAIAQRGSANRQTELSDVRARLQAGQVIPLEVTKAELTAASAALSVSASITAWRQAYLEVQRAVGVSPGPIPKASAGAALAWPDQSAALAAARAAIEHGAEIQALDAAVLATRSDQARATANQAPALSAVVAGGHRGLRLDQTTGEWSLALRLDWTPYDGGAAWSARESAGAQLRILADRRADLKRQRASVVADLAASLAGLNERLIAARTIANQARTIYDEARGHYRNGRLTRLDLADAADTNDQADREVVLIDADRRVVIEHLNAAAE